MTFGSVDDARVTCPTDLRRSEVLAVPRDRVAGVRADSFNVDFRVVVRLEGLKVERENVVRALVDEFRVEVAVAARQRDPATEFLVRDEIRERFPRAVGVTRDVIHCVRRAR